jgi:hypothetical protein
MTLKTKKTPKVMIQMKTKPKIKKTRNLKSQRRIRKARAKIKKVRRIRRIKRKLMRKGIKKKVNDCYLMAMIQKKSLKAQVH